MIPRYKLLKAMGDMSSCTLRQELDKYDFVARWDVQDMIDNGVIGRLIPLVAHILGMKEYKKDGFVPKIRERIIINEQQLNMVLPRPEYKRKYPIKSRDQRHLVDAIIDKFGGRQAICDTLNKAYSLKLSTKSLRAWRCFISTDGAQGTIPIKYHRKIVAVAQAEGLNITLDDLSCFKGRKHNRGI